MECKMCGKILSEQERFCTYCGHYYDPNEMEENLQPVELKSKTGSLDKKINDGAYVTMIERITSNQNPDFFFMNYSKEWPRIQSLPFPISDKIHHSLLQNYFSSLYIPLLLCWSHCTPPYYNNLFVCLSLPWPRDSFMMRTV